MIGIDKYDSIVFILWCEVSDEKKEVRGKEKGKEERESEGERGIGRIRKNKREGGREEERK